jgi:DNA (cytosine-5)-methyltransferase 1
MPLPEAPLLAVDLFAGAGGMSCGLEMAGVRVVAGVERDPFAHETFRHNHPHARATAAPADVHEVTGDALLAEAGVPRVDLVVGGPPCQGFSQAGYRDPGDLRNSLVFQYVRLVGELRPRFLVMENVVGMLSFRISPSEMVMDRLARELAALGYSLNVTAGRPETWKAAVVDAADHGVPQHRRRVLVIGWLGDHAPVLRPTHAPADRAALLGLAPHVTVGEALGDLPEPTVEEPQPFGPATEPSGFARLMRSGAAMLPDHVPTTHRADMVVRMREQAVGTPLYATWAHAWYRLDPAAPSPTVKENHNAPFVHPASPRVTTPRECARLQSFPDRFVFSGRKSRKLVQIGNAVPPLLGRAIGRAVLEAAASGDASEPAAASQQAQGAGA